MSSIHEVGLESVVGGWVVRGGDDDSGDDDDYDEREWYVKAAHFEIDRTFDQLAFAPDSLADRWFNQAERPTAIPYADRPASQLFVVEK